jgi:hypothetical protein
MLEGCCAMLGNSVDMASLSASQFWIIPGSLSVFARSSGKFEQILRYVRRSTPPE